ncbi:MAG: AMP-binding protein [Candidatus Omnitrophica bacterium]|nr:AMP-binding protein [Candidatus Omnitrophota bacterium]
MLVNEFLENSAKANPEKTALICQNKRFAYNEINSMANQLSNACIGFGFDKKDRGAVYLDNSLETVVSIFGILKASGMFIVINPQVKEKKIEYILNDAQVKILITDSKHLQAIPEIFNNCPSLKKVLIIDFERAKQRNPQFPINNTNIVSFYATLEKQSAVCPIKQCIDIDLCCLIYTSGSTGNPKGVMLTHLNMVTAADSIIEYLQNTSDDIILNCLPLAFDYGLYQVLMAFKFGGTVVLEKSFVYPYQIIDLIIKEKVTGFPFVPAILALLLQLKNFEIIDFSNLRYVTNTAQALSVQHILKFRKFFPHVEFYSMYGLTECKRVAYLSPEKIDQKPNSVGKAMPNTEAYIVNEKGEKITSPDEIGELVIRGANIMKGYWNLPELTAQRLKSAFYPEEKVLYSGDLFKMDEDGDLYFISRKDDIIKTAGEMVSPKEVEDVLYELEEVVEAAVIGVDDEILGKAIKAFVVLKESSQLKENEILLHCSKCLENFMVPKSIEIRYSALPKTSTGKISKKDLVNG